jgi:hypothetical protein
MTMWRLARANNIDSAPGPEPDTTILLDSGLLVLFGASRNKFKKIGRFMNSNCKLVNGSAFKAKSIEKAIKYQKIRAKIPNY